MKIKYYDGCDTGIEVDYKNFYDISDEKKKKIIHEIIDKLSNETLFHVLADICTILGEYEDMGYCEQCCSENFEYNLKI